MGQCIGYGEHKGVCPNCTEVNGNPVFCPRCMELRKEDVEKKKKLQKEAQEQTEKHIKERA